MNNHYQPNAAAAASSLLVSFFLFQDSFLFTLFFKEMDFMLPLIDHKR